MSINSEDLMPTIHGAKSEKVAEDSQTASEYINEQLALEADAREILPYKFDKCTYSLGPLRQGVFACLTCSPPPASPAQVYTPAGICYACSISCHGNHTLVELFTRRNFTCDCGTTRFSSTSPCTLRHDAVTGARGVHSQEAAKTNKYNQNFQNLFCGCGTEYDAETEKGTMYQCLGLGSTEDGGCGEDWWHPHCLMGLPSDWPERLGQIEAKESSTEEADQEENSHPVPKGFPDDEEFSTLICYKCVESNPWLKPYAGTKEILPPLHKVNPSVSEPVAEIAPNSTTITTKTSSLKRKASDVDETDRSLSPTKRLKDDERDEKDNTSTNQTASSSQLTKKHIHEALPPAPSGTISLLMKKDFREYLCHCPRCFPNLIPHPQLQEEEDEYQPSISDSQESVVGGGGSGTRSAGTGSLLERGEAALNNVDRVRAIEGVMVYNHLKDKVKAFLKPYAESGQAVGAEDIKAYFEKLRGDEAAIKEAAERPTAADQQDHDNADGGGGPAGPDGNNRKEQSGY